MTLAELVTAARFKQALAMDVGAMVACVFVNANRAERSEPARPCEFNPYRDDETGECLL